MTTQTLSLFLSVCLSVYLSVCLSVCLSLPLSTRERVIKSGIYISISIPTSQLDTVIWPSSINHSFVLCLFVRPSVWLSRCLSGHVSCTCNVRNASGHAPESSRFITRIKSTGKGSTAEIRSCVEVEVAVLRSPSLIVRTVFVDVKQHWTNGSIVSIVTGAGPVKVDVSCDS